MVQGMLRRFVLACALSCGLVQHAGAAPIAFNGSDVAVPGRARVLNLSGFAIRALYLGLRCTGISQGVPNVCADVVLTPGAIDNYDYSIGSEPQLARILINTSSQIARSDLDGLVAQGILNVADLSPGVIPPVVDLAQAIPNLIRYLNDPLVVAIELDSTGALDYIVRNAEVEAVLFNASRQNRGLPPISVPAPAALPVFATGLIGFAFMTRRKSLVRN